MNRFILLGGILIAAWFVFMATFPFPDGAWGAFLYSCEQLTTANYGEAAAREYCPAPTLEVARFIVIGATLSLIGFASWAFFRGTRD